MGNKQRKIFITSLSILFVIAVVVVGLQFTGDEGITKRPTLESQEVLNLVSSRDGSLFLADSQGNALYINSSDQVENNMLMEGCTDECTQDWRPYEASGQRSFRDSTDPFLRLITIVERPNETFQFALDDQPLYRYSGDEGIGVTNGTSQEGWSLVTLEVLVSSDTAGTPPPTPQE